MSSANISAGPRALREAVAVAAVPRRDRSVLELAADAGGAGLLADREVQRPPEPVSAWSLRPASSKARMRAISRKKCSPGLGGQERRVRHAIQIIEESTGTRRAGGIVAHPRKRLKTRRDGRHLHGAMAQGAQARRAGTDADHPPVRGEPGPAVRAARLHGALPSLYRPGIDRRRHHGGARPGDRLATTHRNHGHVLGRGADPARAMAEILCRTTGLCNGFGGTLHLTDPDIGFLHTSSIVGGCIGLATGAAFALKNEGGDAVAVAFFGDGSLEEGISYESMNFAALWSLPILYICENNSSGALGSVKGGFPDRSVGRDRHHPHAEPVRHAVRGGGRSQLRRGVRGGEPADRSRAQAQGPGVLCMRSPSAGPAPSRCGRSCRPVRPTSRMAWDDGKISGEHADWYRNHDPVFIYVRKLIADGRRCDARRRRGDRREGRREQMARGAEVRGGSPLPPPRRRSSHVFA